MQGIATLAPSDRRIGRANGRVAGSRHRGGIVAPQCHASRSRRASVTCWSDVAGGRATAKSFAWINPWTLDPHYQQLRLRVSPPTRLDAELRLGIVWCYIDWRRCSRSKDVNALAGPWPRPDAVRVIDAADEANQPCIEPGQVRRVLLGVMPPRSRVRDRRFLAHAQTHGARILYPCEVSAMRRSAPGCSGSSRPGPSRRPLWWRPVSTRRACWPCSLQPAAAACSGILAHSMPVPSSPRWSTTDRATSNSSRCGWAPRRNDASSRRTFRRMPRSCAGDRFSKRGATRHHGTRILARYRNTSHGIAGTARLSDARLRPSNGRLSVVAGCRACERACASRTAVWTLARYSVSWSETRSFQPASECSTYDRGMLGVATYFLVRYKRRVYLLMEVALCAEHQDSF